MKDLTSKGFLDGLREMAEKLQKDIDAHRIGLDASPAAISERRRRVLNGDFKFLAYTYFPHHIRGEPSIFQAAFCNRYPKLIAAEAGLREWWIAPRGEAKSSLLSKIGPIYIIIRELLQLAEVRQTIAWTGPTPPTMDYGLLLGAETSLPCKLVEVIKTELTSNAALALDFPEVCGQGSTWRIGEIVTKNGVKVEAFGAEQAVRGTFHGASRPAWLFADDIITDAEAKSPTERNNRWTWITKAIDFIGPPDGSVKFIAVGTVLNKDDPISRAKSNPAHLVHHFRALVKEPINKELWERCEEIMRNDDPPYKMAAAERQEVAAEKDLPSYRYYLQNKPEMDEGAVISWPSVRSLYSLMKAKIANKAAFNTEMQGDGRADEDKVFHPITFWKQASRDWFIYGSCDPSMGKGEKSDPSSILIGGWDGIGQKLHVMYAAIERRVPSKLESDLIRVTQHFNPLAIAFENNNGYEYMRGGLQTAALLKKVAIPLVGITATVPAEIRIDSLEPYITDTLAPRILFDPNLIGLLAELDEWPEPQSQHHYDGLTGLHLLWHISVTRGAGLGGYTPARPEKPTDGRRDRDSDDRDGSYGRMGEHRSTC
jgi:hypothetical protein